KWIEQPVESANTNSRIGVPILRCTLFQQLPMWRLPAGRLLRQRISLAMTLLKESGSKRKSRSTGNPDGPQTSAKSDNEKYPNSCSIPNTNPKNMKSSSVGEPSVTYQAHSASRVKNFMCTTGSETPS